ncbi:hypothetical protein PRZ48_009592 [Zasmidium cellare]|uniref:Rhodopsin domain-containing protein n=1 Tax=Zasmidium cellare TaxID=395010 RepID=A0ABR0ED51_ZASCE|nr:hypothetical protein PRZ48_009592 [Zasmidium cellare]
MGILSNYAPLDDTSDRVAIPSLIFTILTPLFVLARCMTGRIQSGKLWTDDYLIIAAASLTFPGNILMIVACSWGLGKHERDLKTYPPEKLPFDSGETLLQNTLRLYFADQILYQVCMGLFKTAVLIWYTRIFETANKKKFRRICWSLVGVVAIFTTASVFATLFQCDPINVAWLSKPADCFDTNAYWYARAYFNMVTYFIIALLPMPSIFGITGFIDGLQMSKKRMMSLCALFAIELFVCIAAVLRLRSIGPAALMLDRTWNSIDLIMWSIIEDNMGIICACLPALAKPTGRMLKRMCGPPKTSRRNSSVATLVADSEVHEKIWSKASPSTTGSLGNSEALEV